MELLKQIIYVILFFAAFIALLALPILVINYQQKNYFNKLSKKFNLELKSKKFQITRSFPYVTGYLGKHLVSIETTSVGQYKYNLPFDTHTFATPTTKIVFEIKNKNLVFLKLHLKRKIPVEKQYSTSNFFSYFEIETKPETYKSKIFTEDVKRKLIQYGTNHSYLDMMLIENQLITHSIFELTTRKRYEEILEKIKLMKIITRSIDTKF